MRILNKNAVKGETILLFVAILWGSCFTFQKLGMNYIGPYTLGAFRFIIGGLVLLPLILALSKSKASIKKIESFKNVKYKRNTLWKGGTLCGVALFIAATLQQVGLVYTTTGKAAFLTSMQIVVVAIIGIVIVKKVHISTLIGVALAIAGMYFLCIGNGFSIQFGDVLELIGALFWGAQLLFIDKYAKMADAMKLSFIQFIVAGCLSAVFMFIFEKPDVASIYACAIPILYTAIIEVAICYTLQIIGQKYVPPVIASVTLSLESVFAVIFGAIILSENIAGREIFGMILMLLAVTIILIPLDKINFRKKNT